MFVRRYSKDKQKQWDNFIDHAKNGSFIFKRVYMEYHNKKFNDYSLYVIDQKGKWLAVLPGNLKENILYSHQGLTYGGLVTNTRSGLIKTIQILLEIAKFLESINVKTLDLKINPEFNSLIPSGELEYALFKSNAINYRKDTAFVLHQKQKVTYKSGKKSKINRGKKLNYTIQKSTDYTTFWEEILVPNLAEKYQKSPVHSCDEIQYLHDQFQNNIQLWLISLENEIVGGSVIYEYNNVAHTQYISANKLGQSKDALDVLFDFLINEIYHEFDKFDFGTANEYAGKGLNLGLLQWKEGFGARTYCHDFYQLPTSNHHLLQHLLK